MTTHLEALNYRMENTKTGKTCLLYGNSMTAVFQWACALHGGQQSDWIAFRIYNEVSI